MIKKLVDEKYYKYYEAENENVSIPQDPEAGPCPDLSDLLRNTNIQSTNNEPSFDLPLVLNMSSSVQQSDTGTGQSLIAPSLVSSEIVRQLCSILILTY